MINFRSLNKKKKKCGLNLTPGQGIILLALLVKLAKESLLLGNIIFSVSCL